MPDFIFSGKRDNACVGQSAAHSGGPSGLLSPLDHFSDRCEIPLYKAGRWGFETTSNQVAVEIL
jgi:hypothetical protein